MRGREHCSDPGLGGLGFPATGSVSRLSRAQASLGRRGFWEDVRTRGSCLLWTFPEFSHLVPLFLTRTSCCKVTRQVVTLVPGQGGRFQSVLPDRCSSQNTVGTYRETPRSINAQSPNLGRRDRPCLCAGLSSWPHTAQRWPSAWRSETQPVAWAPPGPSALSGCAGGGQHLFLLGSPPRHPALTPG